MALLLSGCGVNEPRSTPIPRTRTEAYVAGSGFSIRQGRVGVAALVRVRGDRAVRAIDLRISLFAQGRRIAEQQDTLPYCPPSTDCWWGQGFFDRRSVDRIRVEVVSTGSTTEATPEVVELPVVIEDDDVVVTLGGEEGTAYLVALRGRRPFFGISFYVRRGESDQLRYGKDEFPTASRHRVIGVLYPGPVPPAVSGPAD